jgi:uncharacterized membrane protein
MSVTTFLSIIGLMFVLELPDKTMIATVVMSSRARPVAVFAGASTAFVVHMAIAVLAGGLLTLLPHTVKEVAIAVLFWVERPISSSFPKSTRKKRAALKVRPSSAALRGERPSRPSR